MQSLLQIGFFLQATPGRLTSIVAALVGLVGLIIGWLALARSNGRIGSRRSRAMTALVMELIGVVISALHLVRTTGGGFGTGKGRAGAIVAVIIGLTGMVLGWLALARSRRITTGSSN